MLEGEREGGPDIAARQAMGQGLHRDRRLQKSFIQREFIGLALELLERQRLVCVQSLKRFHLPS